jgi:hypothetical protein
MGERTGAAQRRARVAWTTAAIVVGACAFAWASSRRLRTSAPDAPAINESEPASQSDEPAPGPATPIVPPAAILHVPRIEGRVKINAETQGKTTWEADTGTTHDLLDASGHGMVPYTEAKARWGHDKLYFLLYAGDLDLEGTVKKHDGALDKDDSFRLEFSSGNSVRVIQVSVLGTLTDVTCPAEDVGRGCDSKWESHAELAVDRDGTLNKIGDNDEEWVVEMAIPLSSLGLAHAKPGTSIPFSVGRCEIGHDGAHACGSWGRGSPRGELVLDP